MRRTHNPEDLEQIELELIDDGAKRVHAFAGRMIVECNSGPHQGTTLYVDSAHHYIGYNVAARRYWVFDHDPDDDEIESYCDTDEEFLAAMLKLGRKTEF